MPQSASMTELEAVNLMLSVIGESPVNSLNSTGLSEVAIARSIITEVSREVQDDGWTFNQESDVELPLSPEGFIYTPLNALRVEKMAYVQAAVTIRGNRLYDRKAHSYIFTSTIKCEVTYFLQYEELPQAARFFIAIRAARKFQKRSISSDTLERFTMQDEMEALANLQDQDTSAGDYNMLTDSWDVARIHVR